MEQKITLQNRLLDVKILSVRKTWNKMYNERCKNHIRNVVWSVTKKGEIRVVTTDEKWIYLNNSRAMIHFNSKVEQLSKVGYTMCLG